MQKALLIAEKPSLKRTLEAVYNSHRSEIPYEIKFLEQRGHLLTLKYPDEIDEEYKTWAWEGLPFHPEDHGGWQYKIIEEKKEGKFLTSKERYRAIKAELESGKYDFVINAGDPDQEGELLIRIVLSALKNSLPVKRYWSNDTTDEKVLEAFLNLKDDDRDPMLVNLLSAAYGRQHSDYRYGMNISRAATLKMGTIVACGRVKTPILAIVCKREYEINNFVPSTCYGVIAEYKDGFTGQLFDDKNDEPTEEDDKDNASKGLIWFDTQQEALDLIHELDNTVIIEKYESKRVENYAPKLFKLASAQIAAGKVGLSSSETLDIIQSLYEKGYISYPRTDCEYISSGENFGAMLKSASCVPALKPYIDSIDSSVIPKVKATKKWVNDAKLKEAGHSALVPTSKAPDFEGLSNKEKLIYTLIARQFVAIFLPPLIQNKVLLVTQTKGHKFKTTGKTLIDPGYSKIFGTKFTDVEIPAHKEGEILSVDEFNVSSKTTTCPKRFTDADLIAVCEAPHKYLDDKRLKSLGKRLVIGTPATRSSIIKELIDGNKYLKRVKEKKVEHIVPTEVGMQIYDNLKDLDICKVDLTGEWEEMLEAVRNGELSLPEMEKEIRKRVDSLIENIKTNTDMTKINSRSKVLCKCPDCGGDIISGQKSFYCSNYKEKGCLNGAYKKICDTTIKDDEFLRLFNGEHLELMIKKDDKTWKQQLQYNKETHRIEFIQSKSPSHESGYVCPKCGSRLKEDEKKIFCTRECGFTFWKTVCGKNISEEDIKMFFSNGSTGLITDLKAKSGKLFNTYLVLNDDKTGTSFKFEDK